MSEDELEGIESQWSEEGLFPFCGEDLWMSKGDLVAMRSMFESRGFKNFTRIIEDHRREFRSCTEDISATDAQRATNGAILWFLNMMEAWPDVVEAAINSAPKSD